MSKPKITKETIEYLADLAHIKLDEGQENKLLEDLQNILAYVSELQEVDTSGVEPMNGGTLLKNNFRADQESDSTNRGAGTDQFSESQDGFLKIPAVFGNKE